MSSLPKDVCAITRLLPGYLPCPDVPGLRNRPEGWCGQCQAALEAEKESVRAEAAGHERWRADFDAWVDSLDQSGEALDGPRDQYLSHEEV